MKRLYFLIITISLFSTLLITCGQSQNEVNVTSPIYTITQSTGLYSAFEIDADQIAVLSEGAVIVPADGQTILFCDRFVDAGLKYALCKVEVLDTGQTGWVLEMFIKKN